MLLLLHRIQQAASSLLTWILISQTLIKGKRLPQSGSLFSYAIFFFTLSHHQSVIALPARPKRKEEHPERCSFIGYGLRQCCFAIEFLSIAVKFLFIHLPAEVASIGSLLLVIGRPVYVL